MLTNIQFSGSSCGGGIFWRAQVGAADLHPHPGAVGTTYYSHLFGHFGLGSRALDISAMAESTHVKHILRSGHSYTSLSRLKTHISWKILHSIPPTSNTVMPPRPKQLLLVTLLAAPPWKKDNFVMKKEMYAPKLQILRSIWFCRNPPRKTRCTRPAWQPRPWRRGCGCEWYRRLCRRRKRIWIKINKWWERISSQCI